jgi:hypothetical protein
MESMGRGVSNQQKQILVLALEAEQNTGDSLSMRDVAERIYGASAHESGNPVPRARRWWESDNPDAYQTAPVEDFEILPQNGFLKTVRSHLQNICLKRGPQGFVTLEDACRIADALWCRPSSHSTWGRIFRKKDWKSVGTVKRGSRTTTKWKYIGKCGVLGTYEEPPGFSSESTITPAMRVAISRAVSRLEVRGLVVRTHEAGSDKFKGILLTDSGRALAEELAEDNG